MASSVLGGKGNAATPGQNANGQTMFGLHSGYGTGFTCLRDKTSAGSNQQIFGKFLAVALPVRTKIGGTVV